MNEKKRALTVTGHPITNDDEEFLILLRKLYKVARDPELKTVIDRISEIVKPKTTSDFFGSSATWTNSEGKVVDGSRAIFEPLPHWTKEDIEAVLKIAKNNYVYGYKQGRFQMAQHVDHVTRLIVISPPRPE